MKKVSIILVVVAVIISAVVILTGKKNQDVPTSTVTTGIKVATSFYPLAEFAKQVGQERMEIINIVPAGAEPHDFEPSPQDIVKIYSTKLFIYNGSGFDPWAKKIIPELEKRGIVVINMTQRFDLLENIDREEEGGRYDPHIWLDPVLAKKEVEIIRDAIKSIDPAGSTTYNSNAQRYLAKLSELDKKYKTGLASCSIRDVVASHAAFGYLAKRYNLNVVSIASLSPEEEPSPRKIVEISKFARKNNINYIFFETLVSPKLAETIANEIGAKTLVFNPIEGLTQKELADGKNYLSIMEENLGNLRQALICK